MSSPRITDKQRSENNKKTNEYHAQLRGSKAEKYLLEDRAFTQEAIDFFTLGYVETPMKGDNMHQGRIVIPYHTRTGVVALRSMSIPDANGSRPEPKYLPWMTGDVTRPFNTTSLDTAEEAYIVEGEMDAIVAWMLGLYVVGIPGVSNWKPVYRPLFRYRKMTIIHDSDDQGQGVEFAKKVAADLGGCAIVGNPKGHDLNSFYAESGREIVLKHFVGVDDE